MYTESDHSVLDAPRIRTIAMETGYSSVNLYDQVDSTTTRARELLMDGTDPEREQLGELSVYASLYQSAGRGRLARAWTAPPGACLAASIVVRPHASADPLARELPEGSYHWMTLIAGLSVVDIWRSYGVDAALKWPNDVIAQGAKGCGILAQLVPESGATEGQRSIIVGIGQNTNMSAEQLPVPTATSLSLCTGAVVDSSEVLTRLLSIFARRYRAFVRAGGDPERPPPPHPPPPKTHPQHPPHPPPPQPTEHQPARPGTRHHRHPWSQRAHEPARRKHRRRPCRRPRRAGAHPHPPRGRNHRALRGGRY